jgi:phytoene dehydrogenase-like protein
MDAIEFAFDDAKYGEPAGEPGHGGADTEPAASNLAPAGQHVLSANVMYVPHGLKGGWTDQRPRAALLAADGGARALRAGHRCAGTGKQRTAHAGGPGSEYRISGGHWHHAEPAIDQLLMMRPTYEAAQYRTPIEGLYLCGAGSHPGGDLNGNAGRNAARAILRGSA